MQMSFFFRGNVGISNLNELFGSESNQNRPANFLQWISDRSAGIDPARFKIIRMEGVQIRALIGKGGETIKARKDGDGMGGKTQPSGVLGEAGMINWNNWRSWLNRWLFCCWGYQIPQWCWHQDWSPSFGQIAGGLVAAVMHTILLICWQEHAAQRGK